VINHQFLGDSAVIAIFLSRQSADFFHSSELGVAVDGTGLYVFGGIGTAGTKETISSLDMSLHYP
jgi:hypothetical protein